MTTNEAEEICGGLSAPSKMPSFSYNLPASTCPTGSLLRKVEGSVCSKCYACKGRYLFKNVKEALARRHASLSNPRWVEAMVYLIDKKSKAVPFFRFHDSGDIQDDEHLNKILMVVRSLPDIQFWLPTLEAARIKRYFFPHGHIPENLNIRISTPMINCEPMTNVVEMVAEKKGITYSTVYSKGTECNIFNICPALRFNTGKCGGCRKCWDRDVKQVIYLRH